MKRAKLLEMEEYIRFRQTISLKELQDHFDVSINTVRRYIATILESNPDIKKVYGGVTVETGAVPRGNAVFHPYSEAPEIQNVSEKQRLCRYAASRIRAHDIIYIDNGTTTSFIPFYIPDELPLTIITNSVNIINAVIKKPNITLATLPGILNRATMSFTGESCSQQMKTYNILKAFLSCVGFSLTAGATNFSVEEYKIKSIAAQKAEEIFLLADHSKIGHSTLMTYCPTSRINTLITDQPLNDEYEETFQKYGNQIVIV